MGDAPDHLRALLEAPSATAPAAKSSLSAWAAAFRVHQWLKNILIFVPLLSSHQLSNLPLVANAALAFVLFGLCASGGYILNDMFDAENDRHHATKRDRPFAAGHLSVGAGQVAMVLLFGVAFAGAFAFLPKFFAMAMAAYALLSLSYSLVLKRQMALDVITLALLYTLRVIAGAAALQLPLTFWLLAFSMFMFLSLAFAKRYAELKDALRRGHMDKARGRDYDPNDLSVISTLGATSGYLSVVIVALYIRDPATEALYSTPNIIWLACPVLLYWITRVWILTHRGEMHQDPVIFAFHDRMSLIAGAAFCAVFVAAL